MDSDFLKEYGAALQKTKHLRNVFVGNKFGKLITYPLTYTFGLISQRIFPPLCNVPVKNTLFWGDVFYTYGYCADFYLCGFLSDDSEVRFTRFLIKTVNPGDIFFDIGANFGFFSLLATKLTENKVYAFEPTPTTYDILKRNSRNKNIITNQIALSNIDGSADFFIYNNPIFSGVNSFYKENVQSMCKEPMNRIVVKKMTLDQYCSSRSVIPSFVKMDVEGSEADVINGGLVCLKKYHPTIVMEVWPEPNQANHQKAIADLLNLEYKLFSIDSNGDLVPLPPERLRNNKYTQNVVLKF